MSENTIAVILVRSLVNSKPNVRTTFEKFNLKVKNACVLLKDTASTRGMLQVVKDYATWGIIDAETKKALEKRGGKGKKFFRLSPPRKGYGKNGVKVPFTMKGALGNRDEKINDLILRMV